MNLYKKLLGILPARPLQVGDVLSVDNGVATIEMPDGGIVTARGDAAPGDRVFFRDGAIEGTTSALPLDTVDI